MYPVQESPFWLERNKTAFFLPLSDLVSDLAGHVASLLQNGKHRTSHATVVSIRPIFFSENGYSFHFYKRLLLNKKRRIFIVFSLFAITEAHLPGLHEGSANHFEVLFLYH